MLKKFLIKTVLLALIGSPALAAVKAGDMAPDFTGVDSNGVSHSLSDFKGKTVVLEWKNHDCPFVVKHYATNNMQKLQKDVTSNDMIWLSINSSALGTKTWQGSISFFNLIILNLELSAIAPILSYLPVLLDKATLLPLSLAVGVQVPSS